MPKQQIFFLMSPRYSENSVFNRNLGRKPKSFAVWKEGLASLPRMGGGVDGAWSLSEQEITHRCLYGKLQRGMCLLVLSICLLNSSTS